MAGVLSDGQIAHFLDKGYVKLEEGFDPNVAKFWTERCWDRLGIDPTDEATWEYDRVHMGGTTEWEIKDFAPKVYEATLEICGADRVAEPVIWSDHFIVNLREGSDREWMPAGPDVKGWHKDGDFFRHFLDSPEQGLLVFVLWTDVEHQGGPTYVATDSIKVMAEFLRDRPEGVLPGDFNFAERIRSCSEFVEATGKAGDVYLLHPFTLHTVSQNVRKLPRIITNPPVHLKEPLCLDREDGDYSLIERCILNALGVDRLEWAPTHPRETVVPERVRRQQELEEKLAAKKAGG